MLALPNEIWSRIFKHYLPYYELYRLLFVSKSFYKLVVLFESFSDNSPKHFNRRKKFYFFIKYNMYFFLDSSNFAKSDYVHSRLSNNGWHVRMEQDLQTDAKFMFSCTRKSEILNFFKKYCMPIHCIVLENNQTFPTEVGTILATNFRFKIPSTYDIMENRIIWKLEHDSPLYKIRGTFFNIRQIIFYNKQIDCTEYFEIYDRINSLSRQLASSLAVMYVLKCYLNITIIDVIYSYSEPAIPLILYKN